MIIRRYTPDDKTAWNSFVAASKNATFLIDRNYMEYHSDRFADHSLLFLDDNGSIRALLPANEKDNELISHGGLTYGGLILSDRTSGAEPLEMFSILVDYLRANGFKRLVYKAIPHIYHRIPAEEDLYALFRFGARLEVRNLSTAIPLANPLHSSRLMERARKRQRKSGITVEEVQTADSFWDIVVEDRRVRHNVKPVHTAAELNLLKSRFPEEIRFFTATAPDGEILGGAVIYKDRGVLHLQYAACTPRGKDLYATDIIYHRLIFDLFPYPASRYFNFGISNEDAGRYLNEGMVAHKEEFGGRSIVYDIYTLDL